MHTPQWLSALAQQLLPRRLWFKLLSLRLRAFDPYVRPTWSQEGEDVILRRLFETTSAGFYVDVGAHHPTWYSNTHLFYRDGWRGVNIDATPGSMNIFRAMRPRDTNIEAAVSDGCKRLTFYEFNVPAFNTFDSALAHSRVTGVFKIVRETVIETRPLADILHQHVPVHQHIDFMNVDVEGSDMAVLASNDWGAHRPMCVVVECLNTSVAEAADSEAGTFLSALGYIQVAKTAHTAIFRLDSQLQKEGSG